MLQLDPVLPTYSSDQMAQHAWSLLLSHLQSDDGHGFYKHPNLSLYGDSRFPDFVVLTKEYPVLIVNSVASNINDLNSVSNDKWVDSKGHEFNPIIETADMLEALSQRFNRDRRIRGLIKPIGLLIMSLINKADFIKKFSDFDINSTDLIIVWADNDISITRLTQTLNEEQFSIALSILQTANMIAPPTATSIRHPTNRLDEAIEQLDNAIMLLDTEQQKAALNIPPGPQCIRGLAGTGKTVLLAMKAASIHSHYPDKKLLFTFNTQSLYNQVRNLITRFYRVHNQNDPNWELLHVRHGWGGSHRSGVYYDLCRRQGYEPLTFNEARFLNKIEPFQGCCQRALKNGVKEYYDFALVDEAQDFPSEFFHLLWELTAEPHRIYYAYDELQSLSSLEMRPPKELFGTNPDGSERFLVDGEYSGPIEKILTLTKSYRCPLPILMLAHGIGLGIHAPTGPVQMLGSSASWIALGYDPGSSVLANGQNVMICRPPENSPNIVSDIYRGKRCAITINNFNSREEELKEVAKLITDDIKVQKVKPHHVLVISLDSQNAKKDMSRLQILLQESDVASTIPGLYNDAAEFAEVGYVTLSTVYRAKGNEAPIVYIIAFEKLQDYVNEISYRNRAFTSISRAKGWLTISGVGAQMALVEKELQKILNDLPKFNFVFPDMSQIQRKLDPSETTRRRAQQKNAVRSARDIEALDLEALATSLTPEQLRALAAKITMALEVHGETK